MNVPQRPHLNLDAGLYLFQILETPLALQGDNELKNIENSS